MIRRTLVSGLRARIGETRARGWEGGARDDLDRAGERMISALIAEQTGHEFVFVTDYPVGARPFYHMNLL